MLGGRAGGIVGDDEYSLESDTDLDDACNVRMIGMSATLKDEVGLFAIGEIDLDIFLEVVDIHIIECGLYNVQHLNRFIACGGAELVLFHYIQHRVYQVPAQNDTDLLDGIEFLILRDTVKLVT